MSQKYSVTQKTKVGTTTPEKEKLEMGWGISLWGKMLAIPPPPLIVNKILVCKKDSPSMCV